MWLISPSFSACSVLIPEPSPWHLRSLLCHLIGGPIVLQDSMGSCCVCDIYESLISSRFDAVFVVLAHEIFDERHLAFVEWDLLLCDHAWPLLRLKVYFCHKWLCCVRWSPSFSVNMPVLHALLGQRWIWQREFGPCVCTIPLPPHPFSSVAWRFHWPLFICLLCGQYSISCSTFFC